MSPLSIVKQYIETNRSLIERRKQSLKNAIAEERATSPTKSQSGLWLETCVNPVKSCFMKTVNKIEGDLAYSAAFDLARLVCKQLDKIVDK